MNDAFREKLLAIFRTEADEHLDVMSSTLLEIERSEEPDVRAKGIERVFREAHSLKGAARAVDHAEIESICRALEAVLARLKGGRLGISAALLDALHDAAGVIRGLLASSSHSRLDVHGTVRRLELASGGESGRAVETESSDRRSKEPAPARVEGSTGRSASVAPETVRIDLTRLDALMRRAEEFFGPRLSAAQRLVDLHGITTSIETRMREHRQLQVVRRHLARAIERSIDSVDPADLRRVLDHLESEGESLKAIHDRLMAERRAAESARRTFNSLVDGLHHEVKEMQMLPFSSVMGFLPRLTRELARDQEKDVDLEVLGGDTRIDRRILERIKDPLIHLLRNAIDHGIEPPVVRESKGKPARGRTSISVSHRDGGSVQILLSDDGAGIDRGKVKEEAARAGLATRELLDEWSDSDVLELILQSGLSTSPIVTDLSGHGLGLTIVGEIVEQLGGTIGVESRPDAGTTIRLVLPLTQVTLRGVLVQCGAHRYIIPVSLVERVHRIAAAEVQSIEGRGTIAIDEKTVPLISLAEILELEDRGGDDSAAHISCVVIRSPAERVAFRVDAVIAEQEVMVKGLGPQLAHVRNIAGVSALGTGEIVMVLDSRDLLHSARTVSSQSPGPTAAAGRALAGDVQAQERRASILVVEDSITSRALLKNILEAAGYRVMTAVDGIDAFTKLRSESFDLVVTDVEMPRMDGFDLTAKVRADNRLAEIPIILVTALESRQHRERGIDAGANAYVVKSSFDQSDLLDIVRRFV